MGWILWRVSGGVGFLERLKEVSVVDMVDGRTDGLIGRGGS